VLSLKVERSKLRADPVQLQQRPDRSSTLMLTQAAVQAPVEVPPDSLSPEVGSIDTLLRVLVKLR
jgi:hypothetical protein